MYNSPVRIAIASDHAGFTLKEALKRTLGPSVERLDDFGTDSEESADYPDFAAAVGLRVASGEYDRGILICGTGIGMTIAANKIPGVRAATVWDETTARLCRSHNDANVLALGARELSPEFALALVRVFLETPFAGGRHERRVRKLNGENP